mmetsp:Transcript_7105/g.15176  ORF Transcript_7105/g.15176 Transcript_7105/m.15176 type:complete len:658 (+) Transcript_7105:78-2051(+)
MDGDETKPRKKEVSGDEKRRRMSKQHRKPSFFNAGGGASSWVPFPPPEVSCSFDLRPRVAKVHDERQRAGLPAVMYGSTIDSVYDDSDENDDEDEDESEDAEDQSPTIGGKRVETSAQENTSLTALVFNARKTVRFSTEPTHAEHRDISTGHRARRAFRRLKRSMSHATERWNTLLDAPRELWIIYAMKFLSSYSYFSFALVLTLFLSEEFGLSDLAAGWVYGMYGLMSTVFGVLCGWCIDALGVKKSLIFGSLVGTIARLVLALSTSTNVVLGVLYTALPFAESLGIPILTIGIKRYTNDTNRTYAFSFYYSIMNIAALVAGPAVDIVRGLFPHGISLYGVHLSAIRVVLVSSALSTALMCGAVWCGVREIEVDEEGNVTEFKPSEQTAWDQTIAALLAPAFWRLSLFTALLLGVRLVFRHLDATMPKYLLREFGRGAPFGAVYAINPLLIIFLVPLVGLLTREVGSFDMIVFGSFISGLAPFWICIGNYYWAVAMFMITLSIGEAIYSPRVYEYTMEVAGRGAEGIYTSLASAPLFSVKLITGGMSGWLLQTFCPAYGPRHSRQMWAIIGATSFVSPILMMLLREAIHPSDEPAQEETGDLGLDKPNRGSLKKQHSLMDGVVVEHTHPSSQSAQSHKSPENRDRKVSGAIQIGDE